MAFTIKQIKAKLQAYGVPVEHLGDAAEDICSMHKTDLDAIIEQRNTYKADAETLAQVQKELDDLKAAVTGGWKEKHDKLKKQYDDYKADQDAKATLSAKKSAVRSLLKDAGIGDKHLDSVLRVYDLDGVELDESGAVKDAETLKDSIKTEWSDFIVTVTTEGAHTANPPANNGGPTLTKADIYKKDDKGRYVMSTADRQKALAENPQLMN